MSDLNCSYVNCLLTNLNTHVFMHDQGNQSRVVTGLFEGDTNDAVVVVPTNYAQRQFVQRPVILDIGNKPRHLSLSVYITIRILARSKTLS